jgi:hypothetical protein
MDLTEGSETSAKLNLAPGKYPKENIHVSEHGENLKSRMFKVSPASLQTFIDTRLTLTPSVIPNSNYVIMVTETV